MMNIIYMSIRLDYYILYIQVTFKIFFDRILMISLMAHQCVLCQIVLAIKF